MKTQAEKLHDAALRMEMRKLRRGTGPMISAIAMATPREHRAKKRKVKPQMNADERR